MTWEFSPFLQFATELILILTVAKLGGYLSTRLGQPSVLGELLAGILLGPSLLNITGLTIITNPQELNSFIRELGELGVLLLMFLAGMELHLTELVKNFRVSVRIALLGVMLSFLLVGFVTYAATGGMSQAIFIGLALSATSISISAQTLLELKVLKGRVGLALLGSAVVDDILVLAMFSIVTAISDGKNGWVSIGELLVRLAAFLVIALAIGRWILPRLTRWVTRRLPGYGAVTYALVVLLVFGVLAEWLGGISAILGAFLAGLMFSRLEEKAAVEPGIRALTYTLFAPVFFVSIGLQVDLHLIRTESLILLGFLVLTAVGGKFMGAGLGARWAEFSWQQAAQVGSGMVPRGEVSLIIASVCIAQGLIDSGIFSAVIGAVIITTLITPLLIKVTFTPTSNGKSENVEMSRSETK
jgi:Kef-type K+ transport system membrane component KefB